MSFILRVSLLSLIISSLSSYFQSAQALKSGEIEEIDTSWTILKSKLDKDFSELDNDLTLLNYFEGPFQSKKEQLPTLSVTGRLNDIGQSLQQYCDLQYEPAQPLIKRMQGAVEQIVIWLCSTPEDAKKALPSIVKEHFPRLEYLWPMRGASNDKSSDWHSLRDAFFELYQAKDPAAGGILKTLQSLSITNPEIQKWLENSDEVLGFVLDNQLNLKEEDKENKDSAQVQLKATPQIRAKFLPIKSKMIELSKTAQDKDVHSVLDAFYKQNVAVLKAIADELFPKNGNLTLNDIKVKFKGLIKSNPNLLKSYHYIDQTVSPEQMNKFIDQVYQNDMDPKLCSHTFNLAVQLIESKSIHSEYARNCLFNSIVENYLTKGGCLDGRRDRQFRDLAFMLIALGL